MKKNINTLLDWIKFFLYFIIFLFLNAKYVLNVRIENIRIFHTPRKDNYRKLLPIVCTRKTILLTNLTWLKWLFLLSFRDKFYIQFANTIASKFTSSLFSLLITAHDLLTAFYALFMTERLEFLIIFFFNLFNIYYFFLLF